MTGPDERYRQRAAPTSRELAGLLGRRLGSCTTCGESVFAAQSFTRYGGHVVHVRCAVAERVRRAPAPALPAAPDREPRRI